MSQEIHCNYHPGGMGGLTPPQWFGGSTDNYLKHHSAICCLLPSSIWPATRILPWLSVVMAKPWVKL